MFTRNGKMQKASAYTVNFALPSIKTCPTAGECKKWCYASKGMYNFKNVKEAHNRNLELTKRPNFAELATIELNRKKKVQAVRIHDGGDMYNAKYLNKWLSVAQMKPDLTFYFYTKRVALLKKYMRDGEIPHNVVVIFSYGGKEDHLIDPNKDRHSYVFRDYDTMIKNGYVDASIDDTVAWKSDNHRIGLMIH